VLDTRSVEPQEILVLYENDPARRYAVGDTLFVFGAKQLRGERPIQTSDFHRLRSRPLSERALLASPNRRLDPFPPVVGGRVHLIKEPADDC
jgi:hypothetical protein